MQKFKLYLSAPEFSQLKEYRERIMHTHSPQHVYHVHALILLGSGYTLEQVSHLLMIPVQQLKRYILDYQSQGIESVLTGLTDKRLDIREVKNLVFEGGGTKCLSHLGVISVLEQLGVLPQIERVAGTSAGAITALFISLGYSFEEILSFLQREDIERLWSSDFEPENMSWHWLYNFGYLSHDLAHELAEQLLPNVSRPYLQQNHFKDKIDLMKFVFHAGKKLRQRYGLCDGKKLEQFVQKIISHKLGRHDLTFSELHELKLQNPEKYKDLCVIVFHINSGTTKVFSHENKTREYPIALAVRMSTSVPIFFEPVKLKEENYYCDGGLRCNFAIRGFDNKHPSYKTLGFRHQVPVFNQPIENFHDYIVAILMAIFYSSEAASDNMDDNIDYRTVDIKSERFEKPNNFFRISPQEVHQLIRDGAISLLSYMQTRCQHSFSTQKLELLKKRYREQKFFSKADSQGFLFSYPQKQSTSAALLPSEYSLPRPQGA